MKPLSKMGIKELQESLKHRRRELKQIREEMKIEKEKLQRLRSRYWSIKITERRIRQVLGSLKGKGCPALTYGYFGHPLSTAGCLAKRFKDFCWDKEDMYARHCYCCKLTREQIETLMAYNRILYGDAKYSGESKP